MRLSRLLASAAVVCAVAVAPASPAAAATSVVRLAPGVTLTHASFGMRAGTRTLPERVVTLSVALTSRTALVAAAPGDVIGAPRATVLSMARQEHAIAGVNGDFFYLADPTAVPRGGVTHLGHTLKSALVAKRAALYVTSGGVAAIGDPGFAGTVSTADGHSYRLRSVNSLENARNGGMTIADRALLPAPLPHCAVARLAPTTVAGRYTVRSLTTSATRFGRPALGTRALVTCGAGRVWMHANLVVGHRVTTSLGYAVLHVRTLLSGGRVLIRSGRRFDDRDGLLGYGRQRKPESFGCVLRDGRHVQLGVVDGDRAGAAGMTYAELTTYLLRRQCWSAMTLDGSGSSTLVARRPHHTLAVENRPTNPGGPRRVVDGLFVVRT